ncbi:peptidase T [Clostridium autoethanogenum]|uniref:Peptidase T n=2 Tax=Clostridium autoethanogenum TaxID=84023 RepID=A0A3M0SVV8_9CLOT|nr:peptidase T [Clostridium autoethanogenum]AGY74245.1 peptidase T [Clostridium autoethanogenum DSM 10061]ALU34436.1 Peptidase T [Clostridium autoethanogenum DSM 10061]OVY51156.1 Peptidase T [Clostridium autoethanogenum]RMD02520.1 peptidase T [Clostridium autoethanogenum]
MSKVVEKFTKYIKFDTRSNEEMNTVPTTQGQMVLAKELSKELKKIGMREVSVDENGYVMASLPSNVDKEVPTIGFIAHMDTSPEVSGMNVNPKFIENYDGKDIVLNGEKNIVLSPKDFPELKDYVGKTLITTDGTTLLGADDKAGIAEIITALETLIENPEIKHGNVKVAFTPDEEIGRGPDHFDVEKFNANAAYTVDGGDLGELEYENFNAASAEVIISGINVHPGSAKGIMINSMLIAGEFMSMLPQNETPSTTEGYEGFYHIVALNGGVEQTKLEYIIRDFDEKNFEKRKQFITGAAESLNKKYGKSIVKIEIKDQYKNMKEKIEPVKHIVDIAFEAMKSVDVVPKVQPIRGGTDGASLSFKGLPTPNIFTGGHNFHGKFEYIPVYSMEKAVEVILKIVQLYGKM